MAPPAEIICSALSAFAGSFEARVSRMLLSMKLPGIRLIPVELEIGRQAAPEGAQALQQFLGAGFAGDAEASGVRDMDFNFLAFTQFESLDDGGGDADG